MTYYNGKTWRLDCEGCGAPLRPPFDVEGQGDTLRAGCPQPDCGARTRVVREPGDAPGGTLVARAMLELYRAARGRENPAGEGGGSGP